MHWGEVLTPIVVAAVTGGLGLAGVVVTTRATRRTSTAQHEEQTSYLKNIQDNLLKHDHHLDRLESKVSTLVDTQNILFNMVVEVDGKVTRTANGRKPVSDRRGV